MALAVDPCCSLAWSGSHEDAVQGWTKQEAVLQMVQKSGWTEKGWGLERSRGLLWGREGLSTSQRGVPKWALLSSALTLTLIIS